MKHFDAKSLRRKNAEAIEDEYVSKNYGAKWRDKNPPRKHPDLAVN